VAVSGKAGKVKAGSAKATVVAGVPAKVTLKLSKKIRAKRRKHSVKVKFKITLTPAAGAPVVTTQTVKLKRAG
jgi:hypothetical protein